MPIHNGKNIILVKMFNGKKYKFLAIYKGFTRAKKFIKNMKELTSGSTMYKTVGIGDNEYVIYSRPKSKTKLKVVK